MKKTISILLALVMLLSLAVPAFAAEKLGSDVPNIYISGQGATLALPDGTIIYDGGNMPEGFLTNAVKDCMPYFTDAVKNNDEESWAAYREKFLEYYVPVYSKYALDKNGEASDGSKVADSNWWDEAPRKYYDGSFRIDSFNFKHDWRLDPFANAAELNRYVQHQKTKYGYSKFNFVTRCEGTNVILAYLDEYGYDAVNCVELYVMSANGVDLENALYSGRMQFDAAAIRRFKNTNDMFTSEVSDDTVINDFIDALLELTGDTMMLDAGLAGLQLLAPTIYKEVIVYALRETYGTMPGIWSLIGPDYYQDARKGVFGGYEEEYAGLLEKLDHYDARVRQRLPEIINDAVAAGVKIANYAKYGEFQVQPICETNNEIGDNSVSLKYASLGATTAKYGYTLSDKYIANAEKNGNGKFISPDKMVDASTVLASIRDTTWFICGSEHRQFPNIIHDFMLKYLKANGNMTVFSDPTAPQYMVYEGEENNGDTLTPMVEENATSFESETVVFKNVNWKDMFQRFLKAILTFFKQYLPSLLNK